MALNVFTRERASAPDFTHASATDAKFGALGESFTISGLLVHVRRTAATIAAAVPGSRPKAIPPTFTLGHDIFSSIMSTEDSSSNFAPFTYSLVSPPERFAIMAGPRLRKKGNSFSIKNGIPTFSRPIEFSKPDGVSQRRSPLLPGRADSVNPFVQIPPSKDISKIPSYSLPFPKVPEAAITGFLSLTPAIFTDISFIKNYLF
jgi:hypothetical protein